MSSTLLMKDMKLGNSLGWNAGTVYPSVEDLDYVLLWAASDLLTIEHYDQANRQCCGLHWSSLILNILVPSACSVIFLPKESNSCMHALVQWHCVFTNSSLFEVRRDILLFFPRKADVVVAWKKRRFTLFCDTLTRCMSSSILFWLKLVKIVATCTCTCT